MAAALGIAGPLAQQQEQHDAGQQRAREVVVQRAAQQHAQHAAQLRVLVRQHKAESLLQRQQSVVRMAHELDIARREGVRDVWKARNDAAQTQMIVEAMLLAFTFELVIAGRIPEALHPAVLVVYAVLIGASLIAAVASVSLLLVRHNRLSHYDFARPRRRYRCGEAHPDLTGFYHCHCATLEDVGTVLFRCSATASLAACAVLMSAKWWAHYGDAGAGVLFSVPVALALVGAWAGDVVVPSATAAGTDFGGLRSELADVEAFRAQTGAQAAEDALSDAGTVEDGDPTCAVEAQALPLDSPARGRPLRRRTPRSPRGPDTPTTGSDAYLTPPTPRSPRRADAEDAQATAAPVDAPL